MTVIENLQKRVTKTGGDPEMGYLFSHLVLDKESEHFSADELKVDFLSIVKDGPIDFIHVTSPNNLESMKEKGLILPTGDWIGDLGVGIYVVNEHDQNAIDYLANYLLDYNDSRIDTELLVVTGRYNGSYELCIEGDGHEGYALIKEAIPVAELSFEKTTLKDFIYDYAQYVDISDIDDDY